MLQRGLTSILLVRAGEGNRGPGAETSYQRILVPLDGSQRAECVLPVASALARQEQVELLLAHVTSRPFLFHRLPPTVEEDASSERSIIRNRHRAYRYLKELASGSGANVRIALPVGDSVALALYQLVAEEEIDLEGNSQEVITTHSILRRAPA